MDLFRRQLKLLLWKNFLLRIRQPVILSLELLWPIIIFLTIMGARWTIPPQNAPTCHYNAWALPTAGAIPFLQSLICNIDNDCLNESQYSDIPSYPNSRIEKLVSHIIPLLSDQKLRKFVQALPRGAKMARSILDTLSKHDLQEILANGIPVNTLLKNENSTRMFLNQYFPENVTTSIFNAYIRLPQLFQFVSSSTDFKICDTQNSSFDELIRPTIWPILQKHFCELNESSQQQLLLDVQGYLDIASIVHMVGNVMSQLGRVDIGETISRIGLTIHSLSSKFIFPSLFSGNIFPLLDDLWDVIEDFQQGNIDLNLISLLADDTLPLYGHSDWSMLKTIFDEIKQSTRGLPIVAESVSKNNAVSETSSTSFAELLSWNTDQEDDFLRKKQLNDRRLPASYLRNIEKRNTSFNLLKSFGDWIETGLYILRLLPEEHIARITGHKLFAMFRFFVSTLYELTKSATTQDIRDFFDLAESVFYTMMNDGKGTLAFDAKFWKATLCNKTEFLMHLSIPEGIDPLSLQEFACNITTTAEEVLRWWPSNNIQLRSANAERSEVFKMIEFLVSNSPGEVHRGSKSTTFRTKLLRLQVAFSDFIKHLSQKANLTNSLTGLLRVVHSAFPSMSTGSKVIPFLVKFIRTFTMDLKKCTVGMNDICFDTRETSLVYVDFVKSLTLSVIDGIETILWESLGHDMLNLLQEGNSDFCTIYNTTFVCSENFTLAEINIPSEIFPKKHMQSKTPDWDQLKKDLDYVQGTLIKLQSSNFRNTTYGGIVPPILSVIATSMASIHLLLPTSDCPIFPVTAKPIDTTFCYILRLQHMKQSWQVANHHLNLAVHSMDDKHAAFVWNALAMLVRQIFQLASMSDLVELPDAEEEIIDTLNALSLSSLSNENERTEFDLENHIRLALTVTKLIGSSLETEAVQLRSLFHTLQSIVNLIVNKIRALASLSSDSLNGEKSIVRVEEVFSGATVTQEVVKSLLPRLPEVLSTLFWTSLAQGKLHHLAVESRRNLTIVTKLLCNETVTDYLYNPSFDEPNQWNSLMNDVCAHPYFKVFEELLEDPDIQGVIFEADNTEDPIEWDELQSSVTELTSLVVKLDKERKLDSSVLPTSPVIWKELWTNISKTMQNPTVVVYVLTNSLFYKFCDPSTLQTGKFKLFGVGMRLPKPFQMTNVTKLAETFCSMSQESFADDLIKKFNELLYLPNANLSDNQRDYYVTLLSAMKFHDVIKALFGSDGFTLFQNIENHFLHKWNFSDKMLLYSGGLRAVKDLYVLADFLSDGNLTWKFSSTQLPYILEDINSYVKSGRSLHIRNIVSNKESAEKFFDAVFNSSNSNRMFHMWLTIKADFFSNETERAYLRDACSKQEEINNTNSINERSFLCQNEPSLWVERSIENYGHDTDDIYRNMSEMFKSLFSENGLHHKILLHDKKMKIAWTRRMLESTYHHLSHLEFNSSDWLILQQPSTYFNFSKGFLKAAQKALNSKIHNEKQVCQPSDWSWHWSNSLNKLLDSIPDAGFLCNLMEKNISSVYQEFSNIIEIKKLLTKYFKADSKSWAPNCPDVQPPWFNISLSYISSSLELSERVFTKLSTETLRKAKILSCIQNFRDSVFFQDIIRFSSFAKNIFKLSTGLINSGSMVHNWKDIEKEIITFVVAQLPGFSNLSSFSNFTIPLNESSEYILKIIEQSAFNLNLLSQNNFSIPSLRESFCQPNDKQAINGIILIPLKQEALDDIIDFLCNDGGFEIVFSRINLTLVNQRLRIAQEEEFYSGQWMSRLFSATSGILEDIVGLIRTIRQIAPKSSATTPELLLESVIKISRTTVLQDLLTGLNAIIVKMKEVWNGSPLLGYLQQILHGFQAFQSLKGFNLFNFNVKIQELFQTGNVNEKLILFLQEKHQLDHAQVSEFMNMDLDLNQVLAAQSTSEENIFCGNENAISYKPKLLSLKNISTILCKTMMEEKFKVSFSPLKNIALGKFLKNIGQLSLQGVLSKTEFDIGHVDQTMHILGEATQIIPKLESELEKLLSILDSEIGKKLASLNISQQGVAALGSPEALAASGEILCGKPLKTLQRKFSLLTLVENNEPKIDQKEVENLPNEFCQNGYQQILKMPGGAILWGFLKPLFRGKMLFAPKDLPVAQIVISQVNKTLGKASEYVELLQAIAEGTTGLHYLERKSELLDSIELLINSKSIPKLLGFDIKQISSFLSARDWVTKNLGDDHTSRAAILELVTLVGNVSQCIILNRFVGFDTEASLEKAATKLHMDREFIAGIVFLDGATEVQSANQLKMNIPFLPHHIHYKIRMDIDNVPTAKEIRHRKPLRLQGENFDISGTIGYVLSCEIKNPMELPISKIYLSYNHSIYKWWRPYAYDNFFDDFRYFRGFIQLQELFDSSILKVQSALINTSSIIPFKKYLQQFPYPCHQQDKFGTVLKGSLPGVMTISWIFLIAFLVRDKVLEKELALQEILSVMGLHPALAWFAWFLTGLTTIMLSVSGIVIIMKWGGITPLSDPVILFLFVFDFAVLLIAYCHLMSALFQRAAAAALVAIVTYVLSFFPFLLFITWELYFLFWHKILACTLVATSFCFGCLYLNRLEDQGQGIQWDNLWSSPIPDDSMSMGLAIITMAICSVTYFTAAAYISKIKTITHSGRKVPWYLFPFPTIWGRKVSATVPLCQTENFTFSDISSESMKGASFSIKESVSVRNLQVVYSGRTAKDAKKAISGLCLSLFENQITTLLGHNGAGKTTTIKVLTGRLSPNVGSVSIYGLPIPQCLSEARKLIGYCPQYNTLFEKLTVREHLYLFAQLKGLLFGLQLEKDIDDMLYSLGLMEKQHEWTEYLSGGQRRRLCVGMAFVGGSRFVILDEPTSSVDPLARRSIWDIILRYKHGRTILLTTHHLDEADILSDQVSVLHKGKLLCCGSPLMLKSKFGSGYKLNLYASEMPSSSNSVDLQSQDGEDSGNVSSFNSEEGETNFKHNTKLNMMNGNGIMEFIHCFVPSAELLENDGSRLVVSLPQLTPLSSHSNEPGCFSNLFRDLDICLHSLGFKSYSLSSTSLEEVFLTLCNFEDSKCYYSNSQTITSFHPFDLYNKRNKLDSSCGHKTDLSAGQALKPISQMNETKNAIELATEIHFPLSSPLKIDFEDDVNLHKRHYLQLSQFKCLLKKRFLHTCRNWKIVLCGVLMPCLFIALAMGLAVGRPARRPEPTLKLSPQLYTTKSGSLVSFFRKKICKKGSSGTVSEDGQSCLCKINDQCPSIDMNSVPFVSRANREFFYNLTGYNIPRHLIDTYIKFNEQRYGGWTLINSNAKKLAKYSSYEDKEQNDTIAKIWFDNSGYHAAPSYLNAFNNAILNAMLKSENGFNANERYGITTYNHPMQLSAEQLGQETLLQRLGEIGIAFVFLIGLSLIPSSSALYLVRECSMEEKRVQMASGVGPWLYWGAHLIWDLSSLFITASLASTVIYLFALPPFVHRLNFAAVISLLICFGWASIPLMYVSSRFFKEGSLAFMVLFTTNLFIGLIVLLVVISLHMLNISSDAEQALVVVKRLALVFPQWSLLGGLTSLAQNQLQSDIFYLFGQDTYVNPFNWALLLPNYIVLLVEGAFFYLLNIGFELNIFTSLMIYWRGWTSVSRKASVNSKVKRLEVLRLQNVYQIYQNRLGSNYAVNDVTLGIYRGECFGLVGANGAGKTTLFRLLTGEISPTMGTIAIEESLGKRSDGVFGYCPQSDALDDLLTAREHLKLYALLKGVYTKHISKVVERSLRAFDLNCHADFPVHSLSGGTKRKLCTAIAMIGKPTIILLDEPTSGMDPGSRRLVWQSIIEATSQKRRAAVILSSHSIEECDILCSRIGIMVNGQIQCLGTPQQLKNRFGGGITISFRFKSNNDSSNDYDSVLKFIKLNFPSAQIKAHHCNMVEFVLPNNDMSFSDVFFLLEKGSISLGLQDISLNHVTLDQVFVGFVQQQSDGIQQHQPCVNANSEYVKEENLTFQMNSLLNSASNSDESSNSVLSVDVSCLSEYCNEYSTRL